MQLQQDPHAITLDVFSPASGSQDRPKQATDPAILRGTLGRLASRAVLGIAILTLVTAATLYWFRSTYQDRVLPSVYVGDMDLGGMSHDDAAGLLAQRAASLDQAGIAFTYRDQEWTPTLRELGINFNPQSSLERAYDIGREQDAWERMSSTTGLLRAERRVPFLVRFDEGKLNAWFDGVDQDLGLPPHDAYIVVEGDKVRIEPEVDGTIVDRDHAQSVILDVLRDLQPMETELPIESYQSKVRAADLIPAQSQLETALAKPVKLEYKRERWTLTPADLGQFVVQSVDPTKQGADAVSISLDQRALARWLNEQIAQDINRDPVDARVGWNDRLISLEDSVDGVKIKPTTLAAAVSGSFFSDHATVDVPVTIIEPAVDSSNLDALGITSRLGVGDSNFQGSDPGRETNILVGTNLLNGTLIPPHGEFSFNHSIGVITEEAGFVESQIIDGDRIGRDIGGGICQVSTTVFRAALLAGMPISEWHQHLYQLRFYELDGWTPGLDASILQPDGDPFSGGDFKFINPTDSWLLIEAYTQGTQVVIVLYGPELGYDVKLSEPMIYGTIPEGQDIERVDAELGPGTMFLSESAQQGLDIAYNREVYDRKGEIVLSDQWHSTFAARGDVWTVSPDMKGQSPVGKGV